jgi:hypothetical protein
MVDTISSVRAVLPAHNSLYIVPNVHLLALLVVTNQAITFNLINAMPAILLSVVTAVLWVRALITVYLTTCN